MNALIIILIISILSLFLFISGYACYQSLKQGKDIEKVNLFGNLLQHNTSDQDKEYSLI